ncbi:AMP-binding protein [Gordonia humi]|uniref:AMP-binding protein n=1 Tax=Gordonia humi TaxID=686429 RepID=UPI00160C4EFC
MFKGGGAPCPPEQFHQIRNVMGATVAHDYGMTEVPMAAVADPLDDPSILAATDGRSIPGNTTRLIAADHRPVARGEIGEVQISGRGICHGCTDPVET